MPLAPIKATGEFFTLVIVEELNENDHGFALLTVFKLRRLASVLIEPFAHVRHRGRKWASVQ